MKWWILKVKLNIGQFNNSGLLKLANFNLMAQNEGQVLGIFLYQFIFIFLCVWLFIRRFISLFIQWFPIIFCRCLFVPSFCVELFLGLTFVPTLFPSLILGLPFPFPCSSCLPLRLFIPIMPAPFGRRHPCNE